MVVGRVGEDQEHHLHSLLHQGLAAQLDVNPVIIISAYQHPTGAADPLQATNTLYSRVTRVPQRLDHRERRRGLNRLAVDHDVYILLRITTHTSTGTHQLDRK